MKKLEEQLAIYFRYHRNTKNKLTHFFGIPLIIFAILIPLIWVPIFGSLTLAHVFLFAVLAYYFLLDAPLAFGILLFACVALFFAQMVVIQGVGTSFMFFLGAFLGGWALQFIGHFFEKKKPAFADNLFQLLIGPLFMMAEVFFALGYKPVLAEKIRALADQ